MDVRLAEKAIHVNVLCCAVPVRCNLTESTLTSSVGTPSASLEMAKAPESATTYRRVVVVSHSLPITLTKCASTGGWTAAWDREIARPETAISRYVSLGVRSLDTPVIFVGSPNIYVPVEERAAVEAAIESAGIAAVVVYVDKVVASRFYQGYCKSTLWPILHNVIDVYNSTQVTHAIVDEVAEGIRPIRGGRDNGSGLPESSQPEGWEAARSWNPTEAAETCWQDYCKVNRIVAAAVVENFQEGDLIWIQHYHLMLLPSELARKLRNSANIGARRSPHFRRHVAALAIPSTSSLAGGSRRSLAHSLPDAA